MNLKDLRIRCGFRQQKEFAAALGKKVSTVCMWEKGVNAPRTKDITKISEVLGVSKQEVLDCFS